MATVKKTETPVEIEEVKDVETDPWMIMKKIMIPRAPKGEDKTMYVSINFHDFYIPRNGKEQEVPLPVYEELMRKQQAEDELADFIDSIPDRV